MESEQIKKLRQWVKGLTEFGVLLEMAQEAEAEIFLVGGLVRDWLLCRETADVDLTLSKESLNIAKQFAEQTGGTFILLRQEGELARVVLQDRTFDFAIFRGPDLEADLKGRDFTVNALALSLAQAFSEEKWVLFDPLNGMKDLQDRLLRMAAPDSFEQDPLRMFRAFRLAAQLGMTIDPDTGQAINKKSPLLIHSAPERIHYEWLTLLSQTASILSVQEMERTGLLAVLFPELICLKGIDQDQYHHLDVYRHSLLTFQKMEELIQKVVPLPGDLEAETSSYLTGNQKKAWLKWAALLHDLGKVDRGGEKNGHRIFYGHPESSQGLFARIADRFRLSNQEKIFIDRMIGWHMRPLFLVQEAVQKTLTRRALIRLVKETGGELNGIFLLALADSLAAQGKAKPADKETRLIEVWRKALSLRDERVLTLEQKTPLITGKDLIDLGYRPGPLFKTILSEVEEEQLAGGIGNWAEAIDWIRGRWERG